eukprot:jgi/Botrbrau1/5939/Bobra.0366s0111.1
MAAAEDALAALRQYGDEESDSEDNIDHSIQSMQAERSHATNSMKVGKRAQLVRKCSAEPEKVDSLWLPPEISEEVTGEPDAGFMAIAHQALADRNAGKEDFVTAFIRSKSFSNPNFLEKMVEQSNIKLGGTNFARSIWDPEALPSEDYYDMLHTQCQASIEGLGKETHKQVTLHEPAVMAQGGSRKRKWDSGPAV